VAKHRIELIPTEVTRRRLELRLTREELAQRAGISIHRLHQIEAGIAGGVYIRTVRSLAAALGCVPEDISEVAEVAS
jgi:transcriptional regulator with XRE-family HTH domain